MTAGRMVQIGAAAMFLGLVLIGVLAVRTLNYGPPAAVELSAREKIEFDVTVAAERLSAALQIATISRRCCSTSRSIARANISAF